MFYNGFEYYIDNDEVIITDYKDKSVIVVNIPETIYGYPVTRVSHEVFWVCKKMMYLTIPNSVRYIDHACFCGCESLISIRLPNSVVYIGNDVFLGCNSLKTIYIPESIEYIGFNCFSNCNSLININNHTFRSMFSLVTNKFIYSNGLIYTIDYQIGYDYRVDNNEYFIDRKRYGSKF
jgi:hypothetical protein